MASVRPWRVRSKPAGILLPSAHAIDRFVHTRLEAAEITPNDDADRLTLVRRLYFDLLGLPPAPGPGYP